MTTKAPAAGSGVIPLQWLSSSFFFSHNNLLLLVLRYFLSSNMRILRSLVSYGSTLLSYRCFCCPPGWCVALTCFYPVESAKPIIELNGGRKPALQESLPAVAASSSCILCMNGGNCSNPVGCCPPPFPAFRPTSFLLCGPLKSSRDSCLQIVYCSCNDNHGCNIFGVIRRGRSNGNG
jgi:hypothetical protein